MQEWNRLLPAVVSSLVLQSIVLALIRKAWAGVWELAWLGSRHTMAVVSH